MLLSIKNKKPLILLSLLTIFCLIFIDNIFFKQPVIAYKTMPNNYIQGVTVTGTVRSKYQLDLAPEVTADIIKLIKVDGDYVKQGEPLAVLDNSSAIAKVQEAQARYEQAKADFEDFKVGNRKQEIQSSSEKVKEFNFRINTQKQLLHQNELEYKNQESRTRRLEKLYKAGAVSYREYEIATYELLKDKESIDIAKGTINELNTQLNQAKESLSLAKEGFKKEQIESRRKAMEAAKANFLAAKEDLDDFTIYAPFDGYISDVLRKKGEIAGPIQPVFKFVKEDFLYFRALVEENNVDFVHMEQKALIVFDAYPKNVFQGCVYKILKEVDPQSGTFIVKVSLPQRYLHKFYPGMTGDITFINIPKGALLIPASFVFEDDRLQYVFIKKGNKAQKIYVISRYFTDYAIVQKGLKEGDVVLKPLPDEVLEDKKRIKIKRRIKSLKGVE